MIRLSNRADHRRLHPNFLVQTRLKVEILELRCVLSASISNLATSQIQQATVTELWHTAAFVEIAMETSSIDANIDAIFVSDKSCHVDMPDLSAKCRPMDDIANTLDQIYGSNLSIALAPSPNSNSVSYLLKSPQEIAQNVSIPPNHEVPPNEFSPHDAQPHEPMTGSGPSNYGVVADEASKDNSREPVASPTRHAAAPFAGDETGRKPAERISSPNSGRPTPAGVFLDIGSPPETSLPPLTTSSSVANYSQFGPKTDGVLSTFVTNPVTSTERYFVKYNASFQVSVRGEATRDQFSAFLLGRREPTRTESKLSTSVVKTFPSLRLQPSVSRPISTSYPTEATDHLGDNPSSKSPPREISGDHAVADRAIGDKVVGDHAVEVKAAVSGLGQAAHVDRHGAWFFNWRPLWDRFIVLGAGSCMMFGSARAKDFKRATAAPSAKQPRYHNRPG